MPIPDDNLQGCYDRKQLRDRFRAIRNLFYADARWQFMGIRLAQ